MIKVIFLLMVSFFSFNAQAIQLHIKVSHKIVDGKIFINGVTNFPKGTKLGVRVSSVADDYSAQDYKLFVNNDGLFQSGGFTNLGNPLVGNYSVEVISRINKFWQNKDILAKLAKFKGSEIQGNKILVKYSMLIDEAKDSSYTVIEKTNLGSLKGSISIRLERKVSKSYLRELALKLREVQPRKYNRLFITYYLPGMKPGSGAWATTHFNPSLRVAILGLTIEEEKVLTKGSEASLGEVIGEWLDETPFVGSKHTLMKKNEKIIMVRKYADGSHSEIEMIQKNQSGMSRFEEKSRSEEYYLIERDGGLGIYDDLGLISTMRAIK